MEREFIAQLDPIISQIYADEEGVYRLRSGDEPYTLTHIREAISLFTTRPHLGMQEAIRDICRTFDLDHEMPEGWTLKGVATFSFKLVGQKVDATLEFARCNTNESAIAVHDSKKYVIELANFAERIYLCQRLGAIHAGMPAHRNRNFDFVFSFDGKELKMDGVTD